MNRKLRASAWALSLLLAGSASVCRGQGSPTGSTAPTPIAAQKSYLSLDQTANNTTLTVSVGQLFEIVLDENGTTGFTWNKVAVGDPVLKLIDETTDYPNERPGQGGTRIFLFRAAQTGDAAIQLTYNRSFETGVPPSQTFAMNVHIGTETSALTKFLNGDMDDDGAITLRDAVLVLRKAVGLD
jgi:predicted secreted protein